MRKRISRGKRIDNGEWVFGYFWSNDVGNSFIRVTEENDEIVLKDYEVIPETVGDYTGLTDKSGKNGKSGKKIFEGDIIAYIGEVCVVKWDDETAKFVLENKNLLCDFEEVWCNRFKAKVVVIGTIYDNPELLEE